MKYLKKFKEAYNNNELEIKEFCELNIPYLIDMKYKIVILGISPLFKIEDTSNLHYIQLLSNIKNGIRMSKDKWSDIKDDVVPFLTYLNSEYPVYMFKDMMSKDSEWTLRNDYHEVLINFSNSRKYFMLDDIINNDINLDEFGEFTSMYIMVKNINK